MNEVKEKERALLRSRPKRKPRRRHLLKVEPLITRGVFTSKKDTKTGRILNFDSNVFHFFCIPFGILLEGKEEEDEFLK